jgi:hypothetical protein
MGVQSINQSCQLSGQEIPVPIKRKSDGHESMVSRDHICVGQWWSIAEKMGWFHVPHSWYGNFMQMATPTIHLDACNRIQFFLRLMGASLSQD